MQKALFSLLLLSFVFCISCGQAKTTGKLFDPNSPDQVSECGSMNVESCEVFVLTNQERLKAGLSALGILNKCNVMAQDHAEDMVARGYFSHDSPTETFSQRVRRYQLSGAWVGENIARAGSSEGAIAGWMNSSGHRANILSNNYRSMGVGYFQGHWVQCFSGFEGD